MEKRRTKTLIGSIIIFVVCAVVIILSISTLVAYFTNKDAYVSSILTQVDKTIANIPDSIKKQLGDEFLNEYRDSYLRQTLTTTLITNFITIPLALITIFFNVKTVLTINNSCFEIINKGKYIVTNICLTAFLYSIVGADSIFTIALIAAIVLLIIDYQNAGKQVTYFKKLKEQEEMERKEQEEKAAREQATLSSPSSPVQEEMTQEKLDEIYQELSSLEKSYKNGEISFEEYKERKEQLQNKN